MRIIVDRGRCEQHGQCAIAAPDLFELDGNGDLHHLEHVPEGQEALAQDAADVCPMQAIALEG
ncbi:ferredoxin [Nitriliruptor alkaliphilus]|uniref:ferredoxin n=1 Tax=Nitriliruptor alkaliphilus TaxID=427918 RepID=UPI0006973753|nr:ferredoxin [Nitriliruptor alkaliphilus]